MQISNMSKPELFGAVMSTRLAPAVSITRGREDTWFHRVCCRFGWAETGVTIKIIIIILDFSCAEILSGLTEVHCT